MVIKTEQRTYKVVVDDCAAPLFHEICIDRKHLFIVTISRTDQRLVGFFDSLHKFGSMHIWPQASRTQ